MIGGGWYHLFGFRCETARLAAVFGQRFSVIPIPKDAGPGHTVIVGRIVGVIDGFSDLLGIADEAAERGFAILCQEFYAGPTALGTFTDLPGDTASGEWIDH